jgi:hypothetical protein
MDARIVDERFMSMLAEAGVDVERPDMLATWQVFKAFAAIALDGTCGGLLFECYLHQHQNEGEFYVHFVRYFYLNDDPYMVDCDFEYEMTPALEGFKASVQVDLAESLEHQPFVEEAEADKGFWQTVVQQQVKRANIYIGEQ